MYQSTPSSWLSIRHSERSQRAFTGSSALIGLLGTCIVRNEAELRDVREGCVTNELFTTRPLQSTRTEAKTFNKTDFDLPGGFKFFREGEGYGAPYVTGRNYIYANHPLSHL